MSSKTKKKLKGAKRVGTKVRFLVHRPKDDDPLDDYIYCYGSIAKRLYMKDGKAIVTEQRTKLRRSGNHKTEGEIIIFEQE